MIISCIAQWKTFYSVETPSHQQAGLIWGGNSKISCHSVVGIRYANHNSESTTCQPFKAFSVRSEHVYYMSCLAFQRFIEKKLLCGVCLECHRECNITFKRVLFSLSSKTVRGKSLLFLHWTKLFSSLTDVEFVSLCHIAVRACRALPQLLEWLHLCIIRLTCLPMFSSHFLRSGVCSIWSLTA